MTHIILARHGETEWNAIGRIQGQTNSNLSERGRAQAQALAARLARLPIGAIYSSDLTRALETIAPGAAALGLPVTALPGLREKGFGDWEGLTLDEVRAADPDGWRRYFVNHEFDAPVPGGETWEQVQSRMAQSLHRARTEHPDADDTVLLVGHGASLRTLLVDALGVPLPVLSHFHLDNVSLSRLDMRADRPARLLLLNDTSHLASLTDNYPEAP